MRNQLRNRFSIAVPTSLAWRKAEPGRPCGRGRRRAAGVPSPGHASKGAPQEPRRAPYLLRRGGEWFTPRAQRTGSTDGTGAPAVEANQDTRPQVPGDQGRPEASGRGREQSYELIVPMKVGNRRAGLPEGRTGGRAKGAGLRPMAKAVDRPPDPKASRPTTERVSNSGHDTHRREGANKPTYWTREA